MISKEDFLKVPPCNVCKDTGWHLIEIDSDEMADQHGMVIGEQIKAKCSHCRRQRRLRELFLENDSLDPQLMFYELSDYLVAADKESFAEKELLYLKNAMSDIQEFISYGGFFIVEGGYNSGKTIFAHIAAREAALQGYLFKIISIGDLAVSLSYLKFGTVAKDNEDNVLFNLSDLVDLDLLIVDDFSLINHYFEKANIRRALIFKLFKDRLKAGKTTIVLVNQNIGSMFSPQVRELKDIPFDFPSVLDKHKRKVTLHGRFKKGKNKVRLEKG